MELQSKLRLNDIKTEFIQTKGDTDARPLVELGSRGIFTADIEAALRQGTIHVAVHSLKDLPIDELSSDTSSDLMICAVLERAPVNDVFVSRQNLTLKAMPGSATIGTSSARRTAELLRQRPDLRALPIRGNVDTRVSKVTELGQYDGVILAKAGLVRLQKEHYISETIPLEHMLPAPAQGAVALQCLKSFEHSKTLSGINHEATWLSVQAERAFLSGLGGGCSLPICAYANVSGHTMFLWTRVLERSGQAMIEQKQSITIDESDADKRVNSARNFGLKMAEKAVRLGALKLLG
jgi:hydroxymethylbilane synthase